MKCITSSAGSVLVNGNLTPWFHPSRGIRQRLKVKEVLELFCEVFGQKVNGDKSYLYLSPNTSETTRERAECLLDVKATKNLGLYLGFPLSPNRPKQWDVELVVRKVKGKLANWKTKNLSKVGRVCLINSILNAIPRYYMQNFHLSASTLKELDRVVVKFLWGDTPEKKALHLIGKDLPCLSTKE